MKTQLTLTVHYPPKQANRPNDFKTADGTKYSTFDAKIASKVAKLLNVPVELEYRVEENGRWVNNMIEDVTPLVSDEEVKKVQQATTAAADSKQATINASAAIARAIEFYGVSGEPILEALDSGAFEDLVDYFVDLIERKAQPKVEEPVAA